MKRAYLKVAAAAALASTAMAAPAEVIAPTAVQWEDEIAVPRSLTGVPGDVDSGRILMNKGAGNCIACHAVTDLSELAFHGEIGPTLDGVADRYTEGELRGMLVDSKRAFPGTMMPAFYRTEGFIRPGNAYTGKPAEGALEPLLTAQEVEDLVAYLGTLRYQN